MSQNDGSPNFLDSKTILAVVLIGVFWMGWQFYLHQKYPDMNKPVVSNDQVENTTQVADENLKKSEGTSVEEKNEAVEKSVENVQTDKTPEVRQEKLISYEDATWRFDISSIGMGIKNIQLKKYKTREGQTITLGVNPAAGEFETRLLNNQQLDFEIKQASEREFIGEAVLNGYKITKRILVKSDSYLFETDVNVAAIDPQFPGLAVIWSDKLFKPQTNNFLMPAIEKHEFLANSEGEIKRVYVDPETDSQEKAEKVNLVALSSHYFASAIIDKSKVVPDAKMRVDRAKEMSFGELFYMPLTKEGEFSISYQAYAGPKLHDLLVGVDAKLGALIDYGMFSWIATILLKTMQWFYALVQNYGVAIILLTLLVRMILLPLNIKAYKSMKGMQVIQPEMQKIREKYKDDQMTMNKEVMDLMKRHNVNPFGGCWPTLLQLPIFFALYQVLGQSIELYQAPFIFWIQDLSLKDPYYVLPVLMGVSMFVQQKITPTTMDPAQAKVLMFMPVIFSFLMITLPSGLTLYIFVSTLFGIFQQMYFMKDNNVLKSVKEAKA